MAKEENRKDSLTSNLLLFDHSDLFQNQSTCTNVSNSLPNRSNKKKKKESAKNIVLPHSRAKLTLYASYLEQYLAILSVVRVVEKIHIFDIFCGTGIYNDGKFGSPILAFNNVNKVDDFLKKYHKTTINDTVLYINDLNEKNVNKVRQYFDSQPKNPNLDIQYYNLDAQKMLEKVLDLVNKQSYKERNLIFLDPYGYSQIKKETILKLIQTKRVEIILFLPASHMHRFKDVVQKEEKKAYDSLRNFIYDFFDESHVIRLNGNSVDRISIFEFINYLCDAFSMKEKYFSTSFYLQRDAANYYALFFLTSNILGLERVIDAKWRIDPVKGQGFLLENRQHTLFKEEIEKQAFEGELLKLRKIIINSLKYNSNINNCDLYYMTLKSNFRPTHSVQILKQLQQEKIIAVTRIDGRRAQKGAFYIDNKYFSKKEEVITITLAENYGGIEH